LLAQINVLNQIFHIYLDFFILSVSSSTGS